jgi:hypothetical protein
MTIHWKALEMHFWMVHVPIVLGRKMYFLNFPPNIFIDVLYEFSVQHVLD